MKPWEKRQRQGTPWERRQAPQFTFEPPTPAESVQEELQERSIPEQVAAGVGASAAETYYGAKELLRRPGAEAISEALGEEFSALSPEDQRRLEEWRAIRGGPAEVGRVVGDVAQVGLPAARAYQAARIGPGLTRAVAPITAESATVGAYEGLKPPRPGQTRLGQAGTAAALNLGLGTAMNVGGRAFLPRGFPKSRAAQREEQMLREVGVEPRLPLSLAAEPRGPVGKGLLWLHQQPLMSLPGTSKALRGQISRSLDDWREAMFLNAVPARARGDIRLPRQYAAEGIENPTQKTFKNIDDWYSKEYKRVLEPYDFDVMAEGPAARIGAAYSQIPTDAARREVTEGFGEILRHHADEGGRISGKAVSDVKRDIRDAMRTADQGNVTRGWSLVLESFENEVERQLKMTNMPHAIAYQELRAPYRNLVTLESAAARPKGQYGEFTPDQLYAASRAKTKREMGERAVAQGRGPLQIPAQRGTRDVYTIDPTKRQQGNIFQLAALGGLTGWGGVSSPVLTGSLWAGILGTVPYGTQRYLMRGYPAQQSLERVTSLPTFRRALGLGRTGYTTSEVD